MAEGFELGAIWGFQFLGIPPKGELDGLTLVGRQPFQFPISRDPPEGGTKGGFALPGDTQGSFQFLGIPPKGERLTLQRECSPTPTVSNF